MHEQLLKITDSELETHRTYMRCYNPGVLLPRYGGKMIIFEKTPELNSKIIADDHHLIATFERVVGFDFTDDVPQTGYLVKNIDDLASLFSHPYAREMFLNLWTTPSLEGFEVGKFTHYYQHNLPQKMYKV
jgi:hypothetical protein